MSSRRFFALCAHLALIVSIDAFSTLDSSADSHMHTEEEEPTSALAVQRARLLIITVDDLNDCSGEAACSKARCQMVPASDAAPTPAGTGSCTLRAALELANTLRSDQAATLMLRAGRFRLAEPLGVQTPASSNTLLAIVIAEAAVGHPE